MDDTTRPPTYPDGSQSEEPVSDISDRTTFNSPAYSSQHPSVNPYGQPMPSEPMAQSSSSQPMGLATSVLTGPLPPTQAPGTLPANSHIRPDTHDLPVSAIQNGQAPLAQRQHGVIDAFYHALLFIGLYTMSGSMTFMMRLYVDKALTTPKAADATSAASYVSTYLGDLQSPLLKIYISAFAVGAILFTILFVLIARKDAVDESRAHSSWRLAVIALALIPAIISILFELGILFYHLLSWDLSLVLAVDSATDMFLSVVIVLYYGWALYQGANHAD